ncbi:selenium metabolism hydrolase [Brevibacillus reuszeri]|uniref:Hydrolase n=1 Tax=Brevibacillus reuszeri TaxID=54915 RepID=A0A0K9YYQ4_9BACL|nr:YgeY family selenium metabolism-linked hydrolase [Brevibacillus reuszeri]KNB73345.1 hydrolase [Brevibacillus reuszeri]MED1856967.1 YgeY family selenium metabolism-linked hydrolase [Brevibacillus reuszeri]GED68279.1 selenium metabolism hydrolase [Brevibacillus reuszeri]
MEQLNSLNVILKETENELISFTQELIRIQSYSGLEREIAACIEQKMLELGFDEVFIDAIGNVVGRIGNGEKVIMFDSHMDTVEVNDPEAWEVPPFSAEIVGGRLYGRGSVDMKSSIAASIYAAALARQAGFCEGKTIYVSCTVDEEYCDGENLRHLFREREIRPDYMVICEPSNNKITLGHKGKAQIVIKTKGVSAHGSAPEKGKNAIYEMAEIIQRVEQTNTELMKREGPRGTLVMSRISSVSASLNAVPSECEVYLDRRLVLGETEETIKSEMDRIIQGKEAAWEIGTLRRKSWTGVEITYDPFHLPWKIDEKHELTQACNAAFVQTFGSEPQEYDFWDFGTNAVTPVSMGIPTIGFGPGDYKLAHMTNESCEVKQIVEACHFYTTLIREV